MSYKHEDVRFVHESAINPDPLYAKKPLGWFVGRCIKMAFHSTSCHVEHLWVKVVGIEGNHLVGALDNDPVVVTHLAFGDRITVSPTQVEAVSYSLEEWLAEARQLAAEGDYFNRHLGAPTKPGAGLERYFHLRMTPRQALRRWASWSPLDEWD